jgi:AcrR family transcriptional regulator
MMADGRRERGAVTRERLLLAARELFGDRGYDATSIDDVLARSEVARGALYHHYRSKAVLFATVVEEVLLEIAERTSAAAHGIDDPLERLRTGSRAWLLLSLNPAILRIALLDPPSALGWTMWRQMDERASLGGLRADLRQLAREGRIADGQVEPLAHMLLAALNEAALFVAYSDERHAALNAAEAAVDTLLVRLAA